LVRAWSLVCTWSLAVLVTGFLAVTGSAHHASGAYFDSTRRVEAKGEITRFVFRNPHSLLFLSEATNGGKAIEWQIEMGPAPQLTRMGWTPAVLKPGEKIRVSGQPSRTAGVHSMCCVTITRVDGSALTPGGRTSEAPIR